MKFGLMYELQLPKPYSPDAERELYKQVLTQVDLADELGYDYVWLVEHHFLTEFAHSSAPEILFGAMAARTKRIRLGHGVVLLPWRYNHPVRVAERAATLDIVSDGRMDLGTGRSVTSVEIDGFQIDPDETEPQWREAISMIPRMWTEDPFSYKGEYFNIPPRSVIPKPVQKPHPPLWLAGVRPTTFKKAGELGLGALCHSMGGYDELVERVNGFREGLKVANPVGQFVNDQFAAVCLIHCGENDKEAREFGGPQVEWTVARSDQIYGAWDEHKVAPESYKYTIERHRKREREEKKTAEEYLNLGSIATGDPDTCLKVIKRYQDAGVDQVLCWMQIGNLPHTKVMDSIRLFGKHVTPYFR